MRVSTGLVATLVICAMTAIGVTGCNTIRGAGKDIQKGGEAVENAAENVEQDINTPRDHKHMLVATAEPGGSVNLSAMTGIEHEKSRTFTISARSTENPVR